MVRNRRTGIRGSLQSLFSYLYHQVRVVGLSSSFFVSSPDPISMCNDTPWPTKSEPQRPKSSHQVSWDDAGEYKFHQRSQEQHEITNSILQSISEPFDRGRCIERARTALQSGGWCGRNRRVREGVWSRYWAGRCGSWGVGWTAHIRADRRLPPAGKARKRVAEEAQVSESGWQRRHK